jgi:succinoglycan biosynthesis protein ExoA
MKESHANLKLIDNPRKIVSTALNAAVAQSRGEIIIRVDGHCKIARDYIQRCVEGLQKYGADGIGGPVETLGSSVIARAIAVAMSSNFGVGGSDFRTQMTRRRLADTVPFPAYSKEILKKGGPFDEELVRNQDDEYNYRLRKIGAKILLAPDVRSEYYSRSSLRSLWWQYFQYGYWKVRVFQKHPRQMKLRQFVPPVFVAALLSSLFVWPWIGNSAFTALVFSYGGVNLIASLHQASKTRWRYFPFLPLSYAALHVGFGSGFLLGLLKFAKMWNLRLQRQAVQPKSVDAQ